MSIYRCLSCKRTYVADSPCKCGWCGNKAADLVGPSSAPFDSIAYFKAVRDHPEEYCTMADIIAEAMAFRAIRKSSTMDELRNEYVLAARAAKGSNNEELLAQLTAAKDLRKEELSL